MSDFSQSECLTFVLTGQNVMEMSSALVGPNTSPHYISITFAPLNFKCNYICRNLSGFTAWLIPDDYFNLASCSRVICCQPTCKAGWIAGLYMSANRMGITCTGIRSDRHKCTHVCTYMSVINNTYLYALVVHVKTVCQIRQDFRRTLTWSDVSTNHTLAPGIRFMNHCVEQCITSC